MAVHAADFLRFLKIINDLVVLRNFKIEIYKLGNLLMAVLTGGIRRSPKGVVCRGLKRTPIGCASHLNVNCNVCSPVGNEPCVIARLRVQESERMDLRTIVLWVHHARNRDSFVLKLGDKCIRWNRAVGLLYDNLKTHNSPCGSGVSVPTQRQIFDIGHIEDVVRLLSTGFVAFWVVSQHCGRTGLLT